jgi:hypothetical protein
VQIVVWLAGPSFCLLARLRSRRKSGLGTLVCVGFAAILLLVLFASIVEHVGARLYSAMEDPFF